MISLSEIKKRSAEETNKILQCISEGNAMKKLGDDVDKTPASVTKYKSGSGWCYRVGLN